MAWIEAHQSLRDHPKILDLMEFTEWDVDTALGKLFRFWWWCVDYAEDGDLRRHNDNRIGRAVGLNGDQSTWFVEQMVRSCWIDRAPYFRVHDWWHYSKNYLQAKYKSTPEKWQQIKDLYVTTDKQISNTLTHTYIHTEQNIHKTPSGPPEGAFELIWGRYPRKVGKDKSFEHFKAQVKSAEDWVAIQNALEKFRTYHKSKGTEENYIPHGKTWFNKQWRDWVDYRTEKIVIPSPPLKPRLPDPKEEDLVSAAEIKELVSKLKTKKVPLVKPNDSDLV